MQNIFHFEGPVRKIFISIVSSFRGPRELGVRLETSILGLIGGGEKEKCGIEYEVLQMQAKHESLIFCILVKRFYHCITGTLASLMTCYSKDYLLMQKRLNVGGGGMQIFESWKYFFDALIRGVSGGKDKNTRCSFWGGGNDSFAS